MKKSKKGIIILAILLFLTLVFILTSTFRRNPNKLTLEENKWINNNKYNVIDISVLNNIPILSYNGKGIIYTFLDYVKDKYSLKFNIVPYNSSSVTSYDYKLEIANTVSDKDLVLMEDELVLISKKNVYYTDIKSLNNLKIGVLEDNKEEIESYAKGLNNEYVSYETYEELTSSFNNEENGLDGIIVLKKMCMDKILKNNYTISYKFNSLKKYYVLKSSTFDEFNSILIKNFNIWSEDNYEDEYNLQELNAYYNFKNVSDVQEKSLKNKKYVYGFIDYGIYNNMSGNTISGYSGLLLKDFNTFSDVAITYTKYSEISKLIEDFNSGKVDFMLNIFENSNENIFSTVPTYNDKLVIVSGDEFNELLVDVNSLKKYVVSTIKNSSIEKYLLSNGVKVKSYNNMKDFSKNFKSSDIAVIDMLNYDYYKTSVFKNSKINSLLTIDSQYNFLINKTNENGVFCDLFDFYLKFNSIEDVITKNYLQISYKNFDYIFVLVIVIIGLLSYVVIDFSSHFKAMLKTMKRKKNHLRKEDKIKYIDQLTSLKNRAYFNSKVEEWDDSQIYPQSIIIVDLNNISYINDNYGREEGDKVITEAANILIQTQLENTEIIRTDGNEFLIYMVGYNEKQVVAYLRGLNREFKGLTHGFGAACGYSVITDEIKSLDDAVNEATLDMKNNKEDMEY